MTITASAVTPKTKYLEVSVEPRDSLWDHNSILNSEMLSKAEAVCASCSTFYCQKNIILKYSFQIKNTKNGLTYEPIIRQSVLSVEAAARAKVPHVCPLSALHVLSLTQMP